MRIAATASASALCAALATAPVVAAPASSAAAKPATKSCRNVEGRTGAAIKLRVTRSFACRSARSDVGNWLHYGDAIGPRPWRCTHRGISVSRWRCALRTSFGGTRPLRSYRLTFTFLDR